MKIKSIKIQNYKSIKFTKISVNELNVFVGQNNHWKTNFFDAINWFFNWFDRGEDHKNICFENNLESGKTYIELTFTWLQDWINSMKNWSKQQALINIFNEIDEIKIRRTTEFDSWKKRELYNINEDKWENLFWTDNSWNDLLPSLEYIHTKVQLNDIWTYKSKTPISEMLGGVLLSIIEENPEYIEFKKKFDELFWDTSEVRTKLNEVSWSVEIFLKKQFPEKSSIKFNVDIPDFWDLLKKFSTEVDDGVPTLIEEKWDWMQRAVMLAIIQAYAEFRKKSWSSKKFIFLIDEAELHLHPSAQRLLKKAFFDICESWEQVFVNTHSSVLVTDTNEKQFIFKVEKENSVTKIVETDENMKMNVVYELLWWTPADIFLPRNFIIVEGQSELKFIERIIQRFYKDRFSNIKILFWWGDISKQKATFYAIHETYKPLMNPVYRDRVVFLYDKPNKDNEEGYKIFKKTHKNLFENEHLHELTEWSLEEYYPWKWKKTFEQVKEMNANREKVDYAFKVAEEISQEEFEKEMCIIFNALQKSEEFGF